MDPLFETLSVEVSARGVSRVRFSGPCPAVAANRLRSAPDGGGGRAGALEREALRQLHEYLAGHRRSFDLPLDLEAATPFRARVLEELRAIPFGETESYGEICRRIGQGSARAVGQAVGWNPLPVIIPCHRVVTGAARLGGFSGGLPRKVALLRIEGIGVSGETFSSRIATRSPTI